MVRKRVAFFPAHPSQLWLLRPVAESIADTADALWILRDKDCMVRVAEELGLDYQVVSRAGRGFLRNSAELAANFWRCLGITRHEDVDLWVSKYGAANWAARLTFRQSVSFNDDDVDVVPLVAWTSYPPAQWVLAPKATRMGRFESKTLHYAGFHELFYLHPSRFKSDPGIRAELGLEPDEKFALLRFSALQAHHDLGARGIQNGFASEVIAALEGMKVFISSERSLPPELERYRLPVSSARIHHVLAAEKALKAADIAPDLVPVPKEISPNCGMAVCIEACNRARALRALVRTEPSHVIDGWEP